MTRIDETQLPGVGVRHDFEAKTGDRIGVITHRSGRRELLIYDRDDPDACRDVVRLDEDDCHTLAELLGGTSVTEHLADLQQVEGLTIDWIAVADDWACAGQSLAEVGARAELGVSIVAVVRDEQTIPSPAGDFILHGGDTAVVVGTPEAIEGTAAVLREQREGR